MKINYFFLFILFFLFSCRDSVSLKNIEENYNVAQEERKKKNFMVAINMFEEICNNHSSSTFAPLSMYQIADIYLNDINNYNIAKNKFKTLHDTYPYSESGKISLFLCGYICNNYLQEFSSAFEYYTAFKKMYPTDSLIFSVDYEINDPNTGLTNYIEIIDSLNSTN